MRLQPTKTFAKNFRKLPENIKKTVHKHLALLLSTARYQKLMECFMSAPPYQRSLKN